MIPCSAEEVAIDLRTVSEILSFVNFLAVLALTTLYWTSRERSGQGHWIAGMGLLSLGFLLNVFRDASIWGPWALVGSNVSVVTALVLFRNGLRRFFRRRLFYLPVFGLLAVYAALVVTFTLIYELGAVRRVLLSSAVCVLSLLVVRDLIRAASRPLRISAGFLALVFAVNAVFFALRGATAFLGTPQTLDSGPLQLATYLEVLGVSILWTAGFILLVSQRLVAENQHAQARQEAIFHTIPDAIMISRLADGKFLEVNQGFSLLSGYERSEVLGRSSLDINVWGNLDDRQRFLELLTRDGKVENAALTFRRKDGATFLGLVTARLLDLDGAVHVVGLVRDLTDRDRAEAALRESEQRYRLLADHVNDVIWTATLDGRLTYVSPSVLALRGYTPDEVLAQSKEEVYCPGSIAVMEEAFRRVRSQIRTGVVLPPPFFEVEQPRKDGTSVWTETSARLMFDEHHRAVGVVGVSRDIGERRRLEQELYVKATTDALTGAMNRRRFLELAEVELKRAKRRRCPLALALLDLDWFKQINDSLGHAAGDKALIAVTQICRRNVRDIDLFARFGGDEFVLMFPDTTVEQARVVLQRIQKDLGGDSAPFTISAGITGLTEAMNGLDRFLERADLMLYQAKTSGRRRVAVDRSSQQTAEER